MSSQPFNLRQYSKDFHKRVLAAERRWKPQIKAALNIQVGQFFSYAEKNGLSLALEHINAVVTEAPILAVLNDLVQKEGLKFVRAEMRILNGLYGSEETTSAYIGKSKRLMPYEEKSFNWAVNWAKRLASFFFTSGFKDVRNITDTTREYLRNRTLKGIQENKTLQEIRQDVITDDINETRANVIVRTEVISTANYGKQEVARSAPILMIKHWTTILDGRERKSHEEIDGEEKDLDETYSNGARYPGDPDLPGRERIQCRCTEYYIPKRDENGIILRKK